MPKSPICLTPCPLSSNLVVCIKPGPAYAPMCLVEDHGKEGYDHGVPLELRAGKWVSFTVNSFDRCGNRLADGS